jgi:drug/metabolite transporter (DMT)-like permease
MIALPKNTALRAGLYMVLCTACFVLGDSCIKYIGSTLPVGEIMAILGLLSCVFLFLICAQQGILPEIRLIFSRSVLLRSTLDLLAGFMFILALLNMPLANMAAIMQTVPLVVAVVGIVLLGEAGGMGRIAAVIVGFLGVMFIVKPTIDSISIFEFLALGTVFMVAARDIVTKKIPAHVPLLIVALANALFACIGGFGIGLAQGFVALQTWQLGVLLAASVFITCGFIFIVATVRLGDLSATAPFRYSEILFAIVAGMLVFNEYPDPWAYFGMTMIIAAGLYAARLETSGVHDAKVELMPPLT